MTITTRFNNLTFDDVTIATFFYCILGGKHVPEKLLKATAGIDRTKLPEPFSTLLYMIRTLGSLDDDAIQVVFSVELEKMLKEQRRENKDFKKTTYASPDIYDDIGY
jgi:hypothetical protein